MPRNNYFEKKRGRQSERTSGKRGIPRPSILIVTEGTETEPNYFSGLKDYINNAHGNSITHAPVLVPRGMGCATMKLVEEANGIWERRKKEFKEVWVVFDEDGDVHFDEAIRAAINKGYRVGWSNKSFEYWLVLHFSYTTAPLEQREWTRKMDNIFRQNRINPNGYDKNDPKLFEIVTSNGGLKRAIAHAKRIESNYCENMLPSQCNPCTKVYQLIESLAPYIPELLE